MLRKTALTLSLLFAGFFSANAFEDISLRLEENEALTIEWSSLRDHQYIIDYSDDLANWQRLGVPLFGNGSQLAKSDVPGPLSRRFYKLTQKDEFDIDVSRFHFGDIGSKWTYQVTDIDDGVVDNYVMVLESKRLSTRNGYSVIEWEERINGSYGGTIYILNDFSNGLFEVGSIDGEGNQQFYDHPVPSMFSHFRPGEEVPFSFTIIEAGPTVQNITTTIETSPLSVAAGTFDEGIKVYSRLSGSIFGFPYSGTVTEWYVLDVGLIKKEDFASVPSIGFSTSSDWELISYELD